MSNKPWSSMTPRERDAALALAIGYTPCGCGNPECDLWAPPEHLSDGGSYRPFPSFTTSRDAMELVEDELEKRGLWLQYTLELANSVYSVDDMIGDSTGQIAMWRLIRAPSDKRAEAAWRVLNNGT